MLNSFIVQSGVLVLVVSFCGCQAGAPSAFPFNNMTRVPPPGTGSYSMPNGYYNNTSALNADSSTMTAGTNAGNLQPTNGGLPATNLVSTSQNSTVVPAQYTNSNQGSFQPPNGNSPTNALPAQFTNGPTTASYNSMPQSSQYQAGNYPTHEMNNTSGEPTNQFSEQSPAPELQWHP